MQRGFSLSAPPLLIRHHSREGRIILCDLGRHGQMRDVVQLGVPHCAVYLDAAVSKTRNSSACMYRVKLGGV